MINYDYWETCGNESFEGMACTSDRHKGKYIEHSIRYNINVNTHGEIKTICIKECARKLKEATGLIVTDESTSDRLSR